MRLLLDQGLPRRSAELLRLEGFDVLHTGEIGMSEALDEEILARAHQEERTIVTLDSDFHTLLARSKASAPSVVRIRIQGLRAERMVVLIPQVLEAISEELARGAVASIDETLKIRVRKLPL
jgi:predicted nuclease of predicted toxin-antitoxin system